MANVTCTVYFREKGTSKIYPVEEAKGRKGSCGVRWYESKRQRQKMIGAYSATTASIHQISYYDVRGEWGQLNSNRRPLPKNRS